MSDPAAPSVNSWLEDELYHQYLYDRQTVDSGWKQVFEADGLIPSQTRPAEKGSTVTIEPPFESPEDAPPQMRALPAPPPAPVTLGPDDSAVPLRGPALKIAENMSASLTVPTATSLRVLPVKVLDENRRSINAHRERNG